jgi:surfactin family lipopeptide synthetase C
LSEEVTSALQQFARQQQLTLNTVIHAAWALLLSRYSGADDLLYGVTVSGRPAELAGVERMVGLFINTLPLRVRLERQLDFCDWLQQLQQRQVEMRRFEYSPLVQVQGWSEVARKLPLFESNLVFENYPSDITRRQQHELQISDLRLVDPPHFPLTILVAPGQQLTLTSEYSQQRFAAATMGRFLKHFALLLEALTVTPDWSLLDLPLLLDDNDQQPDEPSLFNPLPAYQQDQFVFELS